VGSSNSLGFGAEHVLSALKLNSGFGSSLLPADLGTPGSSEVARLKCPPDACQTQQQHTARTSIRWRDGGRDTEEYTHTC